MLCPYLIFARFNDDLKTAASLKVIPALDHFIDVFAPIPPKDSNDKWTQIFIDMILLGATAGFGRTITGALSALPEFSKSNSYVTEAAVKTLVGGATDKIKELRDKKGL
ncbi:hypothetical protein VHEMI03232 [[Torrubiella] hemipterigena]|uniref:Uncharacterized protein n=1 Tax=[Torrubiella] hemipterigena TaxID=1531966 RepID=A0A0A1TAA8_9HYPO|nr:hypothetical protein VHEMI03232 [[Torrubiella] hemipterigena]